MKDGVVYNKPDNKVMVKTNGNEIHIICKKESQLDQVVKRMQTPHCALAGYEEWDDSSDKKWILTFLVTDNEYNIEPELN